VFLLVLPQTYITLFGIKEKKKMEKDIDNVDKSYLFNQFFNENPPPTNNPPCRCSAYPKTAVLQKGDIHFEFRLENSTGSVAEDINIDKCTIIFSSDPMLDTCLIVHCFDSDGINNISLNKDNNISKPTAEIIRFSKGVAYEIGSDKYPALITLNKSLKEMDAKKFKIQFTLINRRRKVAEVTFAAYMHTKKDNPDAPTEESIYNSALTKYHYLIFPHTLVKEQVPSYLSNCEPGTCLVKGSSSVPNHLTLCILGSDKKSIIYWRIPPVIINIGLNNILLSIDDIKYCILQSKSVITVKSFSITYGVATDPNLEIIAKQYKHSLNFYIRNKTNDQAHETDKQFINLAYHFDKETKKKKTFSNT